MATQTPRRRSKLAGLPFDEPPGEMVPGVEGQRPTDHDQGSPAETPAPQPGVQEASGSVVAGVPVTRNPRRLRVVGRVSDEDLISFNCKMSRGLRREVRQAAAEWECDIQDVVAAALAEYLAARGRRVPPFELRQPD